MPVPPPHPPDRDLELMGAGWQYNSHSGLYRLPDKTDWLPRSEARRAASLPVLTDEVKEPQRPTVLEEIRDELRLIRQAIEKIANSGRFVS